MSKADYRRKLVYKVVFIICFFICWQILYELKIWPELLFPSVPSVLKALIDAFAVRGIYDLLMHSLMLLVQGLSMGIVIGIILSCLTVVSRGFSEIYGMLVSLLDLLPGIVLIPIAILWFGIGDGAIIFMVVHSVLWPLSRNIIDGFREIQTIYVEVGKNIGLKKWTLVFGVYIPATLPRIVSGIKVGWARAWRGLISAEMIFGGGSALGIGYYITDRRTNLDIAGIMAAIVIIITIGMVIEYGFFRIIENRTYKKWGMVR